jgi:very-short-patch-repair endonuclease
MERKYNRDILPFARELRKNMTKEENHLWYDFLRNYNVKFTRQKILGKYIADFYCAKAKLVIEVDGSQHYNENGRFYDKERTEVLAGYGITAIRVLNRDINKNFEAVCRYIDFATQQSLSRLSDSSLCTREPED